MDPIADHRLSPSCSAAEVRALCRLGQWHGPTSGTAAGFVQANLVILPAEFAFDFLLFCQRNPKPCPLVEVLEAGAVAPVSTPGADLRTDLPGYRVFREGRLVDEPSDIGALWRDDLVSFLIGCSFSFETALVEAGIALRHLDRGVNVAMYRTALACARTQRLQGSLVVSMRPVRCDLIARAVEVSARFPEVHGAPIHVGDPAALGIRDLGQPDYGDAVEILPGELPVFWACGVTPQAVLVASSVPFFITHQPGKMFVTDRRA